MPNVAQADAAFPSRPITLVVPFAAGGPNDVMSRIVTEHMSRKLGQPIIVENVAGAGGTTGSTRVAKSAPDGYTLVSGHVGTHAASVALYPNLRYDPLVDFTPIGLVAETPILVVARRDLGADSMASFIASAKARGADLTLAHAGVGSISHISCLLFTSVVGFKPVGLPYRGSALAMTDLIAGRSDFSCALLGDVLPFLGDNHLRFLTVSAPARVPQLPDTPTAKEAGLPGFVASSWFAFYLPKDVPDAIRARFTEALGAALDDDAVRKRLELAGLLLPQPDQRGPEPLKRRMAEEIARWQDIVKTAQIRLDP
ncbi:tripartite tricarboxylate transporter substrate-binding protein [Bradyrhizobium sp. LjRoot220]|uniref:Bug family tripartite tricarboxylate transporter substrate binding protein n=1 Tax=Bradyrhizobium sp. LjRoot220 TaxID=3342284 RepID=UPI003ECF5129